MTTGWGSILVATRLEKQVSASFFQTWAALIQRGLRPGDGNYSVAGMTAHRAQNDCVRRLLAGSWDTLCTLDSDARVDVDFLERFRSYEAGWEYDILQAFYCRRGWPPRAIWMKRTALGDMSENIITQPDCHEEVDVAGTHACLIRREVFERMVDGKNAASFDWFYYPRDSDASEDAAFSQEAQALGFRIGATTAIRADHLTEIATGWETYQEYLQVTGRLEMRDRFLALTREIAAYTGASHDMAIARALRGASNLREAWLAANPQTPAEERAFYATTDGYLYDLAAWNSQPLYHEILRQIGGIRNQDVLVVGAGLGVEVETLAAQGCRVQAFDVPGVLRDFAQHRLAGKAGVAWRDDIGGSVDAVVAIDTLEHVHPIEFCATMDRIGQALRPGGRMYLHNNWRQQETYPMHHDNGAAFGAWCSAHGFRQTGDIEWSHCAS